MIDERHWNERSLVRHETIGSRHSPHHRRIVPAAVAAFVAAIASGCIDPRHLAGSTHYYDSDSAVVEVTAAVETGTVPHSLPNSAEPNAANTHSDCSYGYRRRHWRSTDCTRDRWERRTVHSSPVHERHPTLGPDPSVSCPDHYSPALVSGYPIQTTPDDSAARDDRTSNVLDELPPAPRGGS